MAPQRLFLEKRTYRMRRLMDVVRLLPVIGFFFWMVPLMWNTSGEVDRQVGTGEALVYIFAVWAFLAVMALLLWLRTRRFALRDVQAGEGPEAP